MVFLTISITAISLRNHKTPNYQMARLTRINLTPFLTSSESAANLVGLVSVIETREERKD
jgi:hypothetical protein